MKRLIAVLVLMIFGLGVTGTVAGPALADETRTPSSGSAAPGKDAEGISVGLRTATAKEGDIRGLYEYEALPKGVIHDYVAVSNLRYEPVTVRLFAKDATTATGSPFSVQESEATPVDVGSWVGLQKESITIPARKEIIVPFQIGVPFNATPGDHTGAIVMSLLAKEAKPEGGTIVVDHRVGLRILLRVPGDYQPGLSISNLKTSWDGPGTVAGRGDAVVTYDVKNTGNLRMKATQAVRLDSLIPLLPSKDANGTPIEEIQPGGQISVRQVIPDVFGSGPMKAIVTLDPTPVDPELKDVTVKDTTATTAFSAWPWLLIAIVVGLLLLLGIAGRFGMRYVARQRELRAPGDGKRRAAGPADVVDGKRKKVLARLAVPLIVLGASIGLGVPADAADKPPVWTAHANLKQGSDNTPFDVITSGGCPSPGTNVVGFAFGKGFPKEGGSVVGNGDAGVRSDGPFQMPLVSSMKQLVDQQPNPQKLDGVYRIELRCVTPGLETTTGKYVLAIKFDTPTRWKTLKPLTTAKGPNSTGSNQPGSETEPGANGTQAPGGPVPGSAEAETEAARRAAELAGVQDPDKDMKKDGVSWPLVGGGVALLAGTVVLLRRRSTS